MSVECRSGKQKNLYNSIFLPTSFCLEIKAIGHRPLANDGSLGKHFTMPTQSRIPSLTPTPNLCQTEAEWEYACRATSTASYCYGDTPESLGEYAWSKENAGDKTHPVGEKMPNRWGLYDMHGNVFEWCQDWGADYLTGATTDPQGPREGSLRVYRGGGWHSVAGSCRSAYRNWSVPSNRDYRYGFRLALSPSVK